MANKTMADYAEYRRAAVANGHLVAVVGDSRLANGWGSPILGAANSVAEGIQAWLEFLSGGRIRCPYSLNFAVAGETTTQMLARIDAACTAIFAAGCTTVLFLGSTNDRAGGISAATTKSNITTIFGRLKSAGCRIVSIAEMPRGDTTYTSLRLSGTQLAYHMDVVRWLRLRPLYNAQEMSVDVWPDLADKTSASGDAIAGLLRDGLHPSPGASRTIAGKILTAISAFIPPWAPALASGADVYGTDNPYGCPFGNPGLSGGSGSTLPTGWTAAAAAAGMTLAHATLTSGGERKMQHTWSGTPGSAGLSQRLATRYEASASAVGIVPGNIYRVWWPVEWDALTNIRSIHAGFTVDAGTRIALVNQNAYAYPQAAASGVMCLDDIVIPAGTTVAQIAINVVADQASVAASAVIRAGHPFVERVA